MNPNSYEIKVKQMMIGAAREIFVVATHDKIGKTSFAVITPLKNIDALITDQGVTTQHIEEIEAFGIKVIH